MIWHASDTPRHRPVDAPLGSLPGQRDPDRLLEVVRQFRVDEDARYRPGDGATWCNIFAWDVTRALGCEIPHWVHDDGRPGRPGGTCRELTATATAGWLLDHGRRFGWSPATTEQARHCAGLGLPVVAIWANGGTGHGHVAVVLPSQPAPADLLVAQAGATCGEMPLRSAFGSHASDVALWIHA